jgi:hypothetical protein
MGRRAVAVLILLGAIALAVGCGSGSESVSNDEIVRQLGLEQAPGGGYTVGHNPFCSIPDLLNDPDEIQGLTKRQKRSAFTSRNGEVGVLVKTPFAPSCERDVREGLNKLGRKTQQ